MTEYHRYFVKGGTYFFTVNLAKSSGALLVEHIELLRSAFAATRRERPFNIDNDGLRSAPPILLG